MGRTKGPYNAEFPTGTRVGIAPIDELVAFKTSWKLHSPLSDDQLRYGGKVTTVTDVAFYHGGDELYSLEGIPGQWHECCLSDVGGAGDT